MISLCSVSMLGICVRMKWLLSMCRFEDKARTWCEGTLFFVQAAGEYIKESSTIFHPGHHMLFIIFIKLCNNIHSYKSFDNHDYFRICG